LLDFAGPGEVFSATSGFNVYTVSVDGNELLSRHFVTIKPQYSISNAPTPDIFVFPGGNSIESSKDSRILAWIKERVAAGTMCLSVCSGANIIAPTGLLDGINVTTWYGNIPRLQTALPKSKVLENTRFVDNGNIITTAGVSAGIDGASYVVSRIKGLEVAKTTAHYMEYDKWKPGEGRIVYKNSYIQQMEEGSGSSFIEPILTTHSGNNPVPFEGELKDLVTRFKDKVIDQKESDVLDNAIKWYPNSSWFYNELSCLNDKLGKPAPVNEASFLQLIKDGNIEEAQTVYQRTQKNFTGWKLVDENSLNTLAYSILVKGDYNKAIQIFRLIVKDYPDSWNAWDSLGEALLKAGNKKNATESYKRSQALNPNNKNAIKIIKNL
jgi:putative intracellular protease/amidase